MNTEILNRARTRTRLAAASMIGATFVACGGTHILSPRDDGGIAAADGAVVAGTVVITRSGGTPISPYAFGNNYYDWIDFNKDGMIGILGTEAPVKALKLNLIVANSNNTDSNVPELFDNAQIDAYIQYCRAVGAEPMMEVPVDGNNVDAGPTSAQGAADMVTYVNVTKGYGVKYWTIGDEVDNYAAYFAGQGVTPNITISTAADYCNLYKSYAIAMQAANAAANNGFDLKFVGPELAGAYIPGWDWLTPFLDGCKDYVDVASIHAYGFSGTQLSVNGALTGVENYRALLSNVNSIVAQHARPGTPLAVTEVSISYDWDPKQFTQASIEAAPGTFYAAMWDADIMGIALEANLWTLAFWDLAETVQSAPYSVFGFLHTDPSVTPPTYKATPEYYTQQLVSTHFSGTTVVPSGVPPLTSVYASYDASKGSTVTMVINKDSAPKSLTLAVDDLPPQTISFAAMSINIVTIPDDPAAQTNLIEYSAEMAGVAVSGTDAGAADAGSSTLGCQTSTAPDSALISDFSGGVSGTGQILTTNGGTFTFGTPAPTITETNGLLHVTLDAPGTASAQYLGFGFYFNSCVDGHMYSGVKFDIGGTMSGCTMQYAFNYREDSANATDLKGSCTAASCYAGQATITLPASVTSMSIAYSAVSGGVPIAGALTTAAQTYLTGVMWQFTVPAGATADCAVDLTIDNVTFY